MFGWSIIARACRSASKRAITWRVSMLKGHLPLGRSCSAMETVPIPPLRHSRQQSVWTNHRARSFSDGLFQVGFPSVSGDSKKLPAFVPQERLDSRCIPTVQPSPRTLSEHNPR